MATWCGHDSAPRWGLKSGLADEHNKPVAVKRCMQCIYAHHRRTISKKLAFRPCQNCVMPVVATRSKQVVTPRKVVLLSFGCGVCRPLPTCAFPRRSLH